MRKTLGFMIAGAILLGGSTTAAAEVPSVPSAVAEAPVVAAAADTLTAQAAKPTLKNVKIRFNAKSVTLTWSKVKGVKKYGVVVGKSSYLGPFAVHYTKTNKITIKYSAFPYRDGSGKAYYFQVSGKGTKLVTKTGHPKIFLEQLAQVKSIVIGKSGKVSKSKVGALVKKCGKVGGATVVGMGVAGGGLIAASSFIPVLGEVTATAVAATAVTEGVGATIACLTLG